MKPTRAQNYFLHEEYGVGRYGADYFDYILDIGANIGEYTIAFSSLFPSAKIFAYEPVGAAFERLKLNLRSTLPHRQYNNIKIFKEALGDGDDKKVTNTLHTWSNYVMEDEVAESWPRQKCESVKTKTFKQIIQDNNIDLNKNILLKCDCEGGERFLLDKESTDIVKKMKFIGMEIHFVKYNGELVFPNCLKWEEYNEWIGENFKNNFEVMYKFSSKHEGYGHYFMHNRV